MQIEEIENRDDEGRFQDVAGAAEVLEKGYCLYCGRVRIILFIIKGKGFVQWVEENHRCPQGRDV